jgi:glycosyltransferase involved in cell wall biosynthesis
MTPPPPPPPADRERLVLIPSYNTGPRVLETVREARAAWGPVWVVVDGSTDGTGPLLGALARGDPGLEVFVLPENRGKGAAVLHGLREAHHRGFTHALVMDADGQHPADRIPAMMAASRAAPGAMILGLPEFGPEAPALRVKGRRISNWWARLETLGAGIGDSLFGFRVYPVAALLAVMEGRRGMRRFDFDPEAAVRLCWRGVPPVNLPTPVRYLTAEEGGVSHFRYLRDNLLLTRMHARLVCGMLLRLPLLLARRGGDRRGAPPPRPRPPPR